MLISRGWGANAVGKVGVICLDGFASFTIIQNHPKGLPLLLLRWMLEHPNILTCKLRVKDNLSQREVLTISHCIATFYMRHNVVMS